MANYTQEEIDAAVKQIVVEANDKVTRLLQDNMDILKAIADELLERETIVLDDMDRIIAEFEYLVEHLGLGLCWFFWGSLFVIVNHRVN